MLYIGFAYVLCWVYFVVLCFLCCLFGDLVLV